MQAALGDQIVRGAPMSMGTVWPVFLKDQSYWPSSIKVDQSFMGELVLRNEGVAGDVYLGMEYKRKAYLFSLNGQESIWLEENQVLRAQYEGTIRDLLGGLETWEQTKTIQIKFLCGWLEDNVFHYTDSWSVSTLVEVPENGNGNGPPNGNGRPIWPWIAGGVGLIAVVGVVMATRR